MPRPVALRVSYDNDAGFMLRLSKAIEKDTNQPDNWRREIMTHIQSVVQLLMEANKRKMAG